MRHGLSPQLSDIPSSNELLKPVAGDRTAVSDRPMSTFWVPVVLGAGFLFLGVPLTNLTPHIGAWVNLTAIGLGLVLLAGGGLMAYRSRSTSDRRGGRGGEAVVRGADSNAAGGAGGHAGVVQGGRGGDAKVHGNRSAATGGRGGNG